MRPREILIAALVAVGMMLFASVAEAQQRLRQGQPVRNALRIAANAVNQANVNAQIRALNRQAVRNAQLLQFQQLQALQFQAATQGRQLQLVRINGRLVPLQVRGGNTGFGFSQPVGNPFLQVVNPGFVDPQFRNLRNQFLVNQPQFIAVPVRNCR